MEKAERLRPVGPFGVPFGPWGTTSWGMVGFESVGWLLLVMDDEVVEDVVVDEVNGTSIVSELVACETVLDDVAL